jgi:hypothetical protein
MADSLFVLLLVVLFAVTAGVVRFCDRMIGADEDAVSAPADRDNVKAAA